MAKKFVFQFDDVLRVRNIREDEALKKLGAIRGEIASQIELIETVELEKADNVLALMKSRKNLIDIKFIAALENYISFLDRRIRYENDQLSEMRNVEQEKIKKLIEARRDRQIMEDLKESHFEEYKLELDREEQAVSDEIGQQLFFKKRRS